MEYVAEYETQIGLLRKSQKEADFLVDEYLPRPNFLPPAGAATLENQWAGCSLRLEISKAGKGG